MQPRCGVHGASLRAHPKGCAVSRCCPRAPRGRVAAQDARSAFPKARSASAAAQQAGASTWGLLRFFAGCPPRCARRLRCGRVTGAPAPCPACAGAYPAARRTGRSSPPAIACRASFLQGFRAASGRRPAQARYARPCKKRSACWGAAAAGCPQLRPGCGYRARCARPPCRASPVLLAFLGRLRARLRRACSAAFAAPKSRSQ